MNIEYRLNVIAKYGNNWEVEINKEVLPYDASEELWPDKDYMRARVVIYDETGEYKLYDIYSPTSLQSLTTADGILKNLNFSLPALAISSLLPHIREGYNPDFIINSIYDYVKNENWCMSYLTEASKLRLKMRTESEIA